MNDMTPAETGTELADALIDGKVPHTQVTL